MSTPPNSVYFLPWLDLRVILPGVFEECVKRILFEHRLIGENAYELARDHGGTPEDWGFLMHFGEYHAALGWTETVESN